MKYNTFNCILFFALCTVVVSHCRNQVEDRSQNFLKEDFLYEAELTRGAKMDLHIYEFTNLIKDLDFNCENLNAYEVVCDLIGVDLVWEEKIVLRDEKRIGGQTNGKWIRIYVDPCNPFADQIFFHEVGHVLLRHLDKDIRSLLSLEEREGEADYFSFQVIELMDEELNEWPLGDQFY